MTLRVLYVEDNDYLRDTIAMLIESDTRAVQAQPSAEAALAALAQQPFDVLVTDVNLPGRSGLELVREVLPRWPQMQVVLCSGHDLSAGLAALGPRVVALRKPFEPEALDALLDALAHRPAGG